MHAPVVGWYAIVEVQYYIIVVCEKGVHGWMHCNLACIINQLKILLHTNAKVNMLNWGIQYRVYIIIAHIYKWSKHVCCMPDHTGLYYFWHYMYSSHKTITMATSALVS